MVTGDPIENVRATVEAAERLGMISVMVDVCELRALLDCLPAPQPQEEAKEPFIVHAFVMDGTHRACGAKGGRTSVRREAVECAACLDPWSKP